MSNFKEIQRNRIGCTGLLTILFIALKLTGYIKWSWWWVLSPIWISAIIVLAAVVLIALNSALGE